MTYNMDAGHNSWAAYNNSTLIAPSQDMAVDNPWQPAPPIEQQTTADNVPQYQQKYSSVRVLMLYWENGDIGTVLTDMDHFRHTFQDYYRFHVERLRLPDHSPGKALQKFLDRRGFSQGAEQSELVIVCYQGHGGIIDGHLWFAATSKSNSPSLCWASFEKKFVRAEFDFLLILDCCFAGGAGAGSYFDARGKNMVMAAADENKKSHATRARELNDYFLGSNELGGTSAAKPPQTRSFINLLSCHLRSCYYQVRSVSSLVCGLSAHSHLDHIVVENWWRATPYCNFLGVNRGHENLIYLSPLGD